MIEKLRQLNLENENDVDIVHRLLCICDMDEHDFFYELGRQCSFNKSAVKNYIRSNRSIIKAEYLDYMDILCNRRLKSVIEEGSDKDSLSAVRLWKSFNAPVVDDVIVDRGLEFRMGLVSEKV